MLQDKRGNHWRHTYCEMGKWENYEAALKMLYHNFHSTGDNFSKTLSDWFNKWYNIHFDQLADSSHRVQNVHILISFTTCSPVEVSYIPLMLIWAMLELADPLVLLAWQYILKLSVIPVKTCMKSQALIDDPSCFANFIQTFLFS